MALWELLPGLQGRAGRLRAARYFGEPLPEHIYELRGGRRGWSLLPSKSYAVTSFRFKPPLDRDGLLADWRREADESMMAPALEGLLGEHLREADEVFHRYAGEGESVWLLVDNRAARGVLYAV